LIRHSFPTRRSSDLKNCVYNKDVMNIIYNVEYSIKNDLNFI